MTIQKRKLIDGVIPVILCGGGGTRLWPLSRKAFPKQFVADEGEQSLFQETLLRLKRIFVRNPLIVTGEKYKFLASRQAAQIKTDIELICEPEGRNSGPAVLISALYVRARHGADMKAALFASDHVIKGEEAFYNAALAAEKAAAEGKIVTFGIQPNAPSEAYGYIQPGDALPTGAFSVKRFVEKPDRARAEQYLEQGFLWNSGNFLFDVETVIGEFTKFEPEIVRHAQVALDEALPDLGALELSPRYGACKDISFDYAVMEKTDKAAVVRADYFWSDAGVWSAVHDISEQDAAGNSFSGAVYSSDSKNCYVKSAPGSVTALIGMNNTVVVNTGDAVLVTDKYKADEIKNLLTQMKADGLSQAEEGRVTYRPWGNYRSVDSGDRYQVKRITVYPGGKLSLQKHFHRSEHWVVVTGSALVTVGEKNELITENQSVYIPAGVVHRLENPGKLPLELIEVQSGPYLGEDDIVRLEDVYNRA